MSKMEAFQKDSIMIGSKSILAQILAEENIVVEIQNIPTAQFDLKNRKLTIPMLKSGVPEHLYNLFIAHEIGHALWTPTNEYINCGSLYGIVQEHLNIIEDIRIEKSVKEKYPGLERHFISGYKELHSRDFFGTKSVSSKKFGFFDRINLYFKIGFIYPVMFSQEEQVFIDRADNISTWDEVIQLVKDIEFFLKLSRITILNNPPLSNNVIVVDDGLMIIPSSVNDGDGKNDKNNDGDGKNDKNNDGDGKNQKGNHSKGLKTPEVDESVITDTDNLWKILREPSGHIFNITFHDVENWKDYIIDHNEAIDIIDRFISEINVPEHYDIHTMLVSNKLVTDYISVNKGSIAHLTKEFLQKKNAQQMRKVRNYKTGKLDVKRLARYSLTQNLFKTSQYVSKEQSHGLVLFMDWSGSMDTHLTQSLTQLFILTDFCRNVKIPFEVFIFNDKHTLLNTNGERFPAIRENDIIFGGIQLTNILSHNMTYENYRKMQNFLFSLSHIRMIPSFPKNFILNSTPLNESIVLARKIVPAFQKQNNLQIVNTVFVTDGDSNINGIMSANQSYSILPTGGNKKNNFYFLHDPLTKEIIRLDDGLGDLTPALFTLLGIKTNTNVIGFCIVNNDEQIDKHSAISVAYRKSSGVIRKLLQDFSQKGIAIGNGAGYKEFYIIAKGKMVVSSDTLEKFIEKKHHGLGATRTSKELQEIFTSYVKDAYGTRIVLSQFINLIV